jgi:hypothetical protein
MHDPLTVAFEIRRPWPYVRKRERREGEARWQVRLAWGNSYFSPFVYLLGRQLYFPALITVWHRDPEKGGDDDSCRRAWAKRRRRPGLRGWLSRRTPVPYVWHVHHWKIQVRPLQALRRWLFTRCEECGKRFPYGYAPVSHGWNRAKPEHWWHGERGLYHGGPGGVGNCGEIASIRKKREAFERKPLDDWQRGYESQSAWYYGCYPWWREAVLGEDPVTARERAAGHVQRSGLDCRRCKGIGCEHCDNTGHERLERPIPASLVS